MIIIPHIKLEQSLWSEGFVHVAGIDEAGRGPLAGPVTAGAVIIHEENQIVPYVRDSKYMTTKQRRKAFDDIKKQSSAYGVGIIEAEEIDEIGIDQAVKKAMLMALGELEKNFSMKLDYVIVDGIKTLPLEKYSSKRILAGGLYHYSISAGSVLAKVTRDIIMLDIAKDYPEYEFEKHVGYGTKIHMEALKKYGPCPIHRKSFAPVAAVVK